jgi:hypothetical protein
MRLDLSWQDVASLVRVVDLVLTALDLRPGDMVLNLLPGQRVKS